MLVKYCTATLLSKQCRSALFLLWYSMCKPVIISYIHVHAKSTENTSYKRYFDIETTQDKKHSAAQDHIQDSQLHSPQLQ